MLDAWAVVLVEVTLAEADLIATSALKGKGNFGLLWNLIPMLFLRNIPAGLVTN